MLSSRCVDPYSGAKAASNTVSTSEVHSLYIQTNPFHNSSDHACTTHAVIGIAIVRAREGSGDRQRCWNRSLACTRHTGQEENRAGRCITKFSIQAAREWEVLTKCSVQAG